MSQVKFYRGLKVNYNATTHANGIYFATDSQVIILNGKEYGLAGDYKEKLDKAINSITYDAASHIITFTTVDNTTAYTLKIANADANVDGLMSAADKVILDTLNGEVTVDGSVKKQIKDAVDALDVAEVGGSGKVITTISETDGKISATEIDLVAANVGATATEATTDKVAVEGTDVEAQVASLAKSIKTVAKSAATYSVKKVEQGLASNVKEAYQLTQTIEDETIDVGVQIPVYKDSALKSAQIGHVDDTVDETTGVITPGTGNEALTFVYYTVEGKYTLAAIDIADFLRESEFKDGLQVVKGVVSVLKDSTSGKVRIADVPEGAEAKSAADTGWVDVLSVSESGVKVDNLDAAINYAVDKVRKEAISVKAGDGISIATSGTENTIAAKLDSASEEVTIGESSTAAVLSVGADGLKVSNIQNAIDYAKSVIDAYTVNKKAISENPVLDGSDIKLTNYTAIAGGSIEATDTVNEAFNKLDDAMTWHEVN